MQHIPGRPRTCAKAMPEQHGTPVHFVLQRNSLLKVKTPTQPPEHIIDIAIQENKHTVQCGPQLVMFWFQPKTTPDCCRRFMLTKARPAPRVVQPPLPSETVPGEQNAAHDPLLSAT